MGSRGRAFWTGACQRGARPEEDRVPERLFISFILFHFLLLCTSLFYVIFLFILTWIALYLQAWILFLFVFPNFYFAIHFTRLSNLWTSKKKPPSTSHSASSPRQVMQDSD